MAVKVGPQHIGKNTHHIKLTDSGSTELGLICVDRRGNRKGQVAVNPFPQYASQLRQTKAKHADRVPPFEDIPLSDFSGGMPVLHHDEDASKYLEGYRMDTSQSGRVMLGGRDTYLTGIRDFNEHRPEGTDTSSWGALFSTGNTSYTDSFAVDAVDGVSYEADKAILWLKKYVGSPTGDITVSLTDNSDVQVGSASVTYAAASLTDVGPYEVEFNWTGTETLTHGTTYKIKIAFSGGDQDNRVGVLGSPDPTASDPCYRVLDNTADYNMLYFEYRGGFYGITQPANRGNSGLYQLGTRALADSNSGDKTYLVDADKDFSSSGYNVGAGDLIKIIAGPGSEEDQPWRVAVAGADNQISVSPDWLVAHTTNTEYVVITDEWEQVDVNNGASKDFDFYVTGVTVTDRVIHLAGGRLDYHHRLRFGNDDGTWTLEGLIDSGEIAESWRADKFLPIRHDGYKDERPVYDLYVAGLQEHTDDLNLPNTVMGLRTPPFWGSPYFPVGTLASADAWVNSDYSDNVEIYHDRGWCAIEWNDTFSTGRLARRNINVDMSGAELILFSMSTDTALAADVLQLKLNDGKGNTVSFNLPAIATGDDMHDDMYWYEISLHDVNTAPTHSFIDFTSIDRVILQVASGKDQNDDIKIKIGQAGFVLATRNPNNERYEIGLTERVNNMIEYGGGAGGVTRKPWVGTNKNVYYIEGGFLKPIYLKEIEELEHYRNCELMVVNDVYLYFNQEEKIQRYYAGHLDNVGPDADYGLPEARRGIPCSGASYPGRVYVAIDAGSSGTSSVIYRKNHGWHEAYRAPLAGRRIKQIHIVGRDDASDRMYISEGADTLWVPVSLSPELDSDYYFTSFGEIITPRIYGGLRETEKYYHALTAIQEAGGSDALSTAQIWISFKTSENETWTFRNDAFVDVPRERITLATTNDTEGRWIQFKISFETYDGTYSPVLVSLVLDSLERLKSNNTYTYTVELKEGKTLDMLGKEDDTGIAKLEQLETWIDSPLPLTLNSTSAFEDDKLVFIEPGIRQTLYHKVNQKGQEMRIATLTLIEVE